jgi:hypothetical protein
LDSEFQFRYTYLSPILVGGFFMSGPYYISTIGSGNPLPIGTYVMPRGTLRVVIKQGRKCKDDRQIYFETIGKTGGSEMVPLLMEDLAALIAFIRHNESINYPPEEGKLGGDMFMRLCDAVMRDGTKKVVQDYALGKRDDVVPTRELAAA